MKNTFENREASADFGVDDLNIVQFNPNPLKYYCWSVGNGKGKYGITNSNSISIEICSNLKRVVLLNMQILMVGILQKIH